jgi:hypothetical protein
VKGEGSGPVVSPASPVGAGSSGAWGVQNLDKKSTSNVINRLDNLLVNIQHLKVMGFSLFSSSPR